MLVTTSGPAPNGSSFAGVLETAPARAAYQEAVGVPLLVCRLHVDLAVVRPRLRRRHQDPPEVLRWHLHRCEELDAILTSAHVEDFVIDATTLTISQAAAAVIHGAGWDERTRLREPTPRAGD